MITPDYFFYKLKLCEAYDLLRGIEEKEDREVRRGYEQHRFTAGIIYKTLTGGVLDLSFPWEKENDSETSDDGSMTEEEVEETRRILQELNKKNNEEINTKSDDED